MRSAVQVALTAEAEATWNETSAHAPVARTSMSSSGVRGSGLTSPAAPITEMVHDVPAACEHCCDHRPALRERGGRSAHPEDQAGRGDSGMAGHGDDRGFLRPGHGTVGADDGHGGAGQRDIERGAVVVERVRDAAPVVAQLPGRQQLEVEGRRLARPDREGCRVQLRLRVQGAHHDRHREVGPVVLAGQPHRHLTGIRPRRPGAGGVAHLGARCRRRSRRRRARRRHGCRRRPRARRHRAPRPGRPCRT